MYEPTESAHTTRTLTQQLTELGVKPGMNLLVHCALSKLGYVVGGAETLINALGNALGDAGTLVMPAHSAQLSDPAKWSNPPVPEHWWPTIRNEAPAFDPIRTPTRMMGTVAENFRRYPDVVRSGHPQGSFTARGPKAEKITAGHELGSMFGDASPLGRLYELDGHVLLIGVTHGNDTSLHLAETRATIPDKPIHTEGSPMLVDGKSQWVWFDEVQFEDEDFEELGEAFAASGNTESQGLLGNATARLFSQRRVVDFGVEWLTANRRY